MAEELWKASAVELAVGIRDKRFSCIEVMTSVVERIRALNPTLNAIVVDRSEQALAEAAAADRVRTSGVELGPLFGMPVTIKALWPRTLGNFR
jgi:amidase